MKKLVFGIISLVLGVAALVTSFSMLASVLPTEGPMRGKLLPRLILPYPEFGLQVVALMGVGGLLLLAGLILTIFGAKER